jgi:hypothetical protein
MDIDPNDPNDPLFQSVKVPLKSVIRNQNHIPIIEDYVETYHQITVHALQFLKLYYLRAFEDGLVIDISKKLIVNICITVSTHQETGKPPAADTQQMRNELNDFYNTFYWLTIPEGEGKPVSTNLHTAIEYASEEIITMYENIVKQRFYCCVEKYIKFLIGYDEAIENIHGNDNLTRQQKIAAKATLNRRTMRFVQDVFVTEGQLVNGEWLYDYSSLELMPPDARAGHRLLLDTAKDDVLPNGDFENDNIFYDIKAHPLRYFSKMVFMMRLFEVNDIKLDNLFPLRTSKIPGHMKIDTTILIKMLYPRYDEQWMENYDYVMGRTGSTTRSNATAKNYLSEHKDLLWDIFFKCKELQQIFHGSVVLDEGHSLDDVDNDYENYCTSHPYTFRHMIGTDGISCTVLLVRKKDAHDKHPHKPPNAPIEENYIHEIDEITRQEIANKTLVGIDPGCADLLRAVNCDENKKWRYTQNQVRRETNRPFNRKQLKMERRYYLVNGASIEQLESQFGDGFNRKVMTFNSFFTYCLSHNQLIARVKPFYNQHKHRKRRFQSYRKRQKSEARMLVSFKEKFGNPDETIVCIGDWCETEGHHRRFVEPVKGKGFRKLFKKAGYQLFLVDEFRTSKMCSKCEDEGAKCEKFRWVKNPKPRSRVEYPITLCHGLLRCTTCNTLWDRDILGATNIYKISKMAINGEDRPEYLRRQQQQQQQ